MRTGRRFSDGRGKLDDGKRGQFRQLRRGQRQRDELDGGTLTCRKIILSAITALRIRFGETVVLIFVVTIVIVVKSKVDVRARQAQVEIRRALAGQHCDAQDDVRENAQQNRSFSPPLGIWFRQAETNNARITVCQTVFRNSKIECSIFIGCVYFFR